jgi:hypothetical protein
MLISEAGQLELVEANMPDLGYPATPVVPELGGKACEKPPRLDLRRSRLDPCLSPPEVVGAPPDALCHLAESSLLLRGLGRENKMQRVSGLLSCPRARCSHVHCPCSVCFQHPFDRVVAGRTLTLLGGRLYEQCAVTITLGTLPEAASR